MLNKKELEAIEHKARLALKNDGFKSALRERGIEPDSSKIGASDIYAIHIASMYFGFVLALEMHEDESDVLSAEITI